MKKMKRMLSLIMVICMCIGLCACGSKDKNPTGDEYADGDTIEIELWSTYGSLGNGFIDKLVDEFNMMQDEYFVSLVNNGSASEVRKKLAMLDKEKYPALFCGQPYTTAYYAESDFVLPIQDLIDKDEEDWASGLYASVRNAYSDLDGNMMGWPLGVSCSGWWVNVDALKQAGYTLEDITSYEKAAEIAKALVNKGICEYGMSYLATGVELMDMMTIQGLSYVDGNNGHSGKVTKSVLLEGENYEGMKKVASIHANLIDTKVAMEYGSVVESTCMPLFNSGKLGLAYATNSWGHYVFAAAPTFEYAFVPSTGIDENAKYKGNVLPEGTGLYICNTGNDRKTQGAYEFIKFLSQAENQVYLCKAMGYIPYTNEAAQLEEYTTWATENLPSMLSLIDKVKNTSEELRSPYVAFSDEMLNVCTDLLGNLSYDPKGDIDVYMKDANRVLETGLTTWLERQ